MFGLNLRINITACDDLCAKLFHSSQICDQRGYYIDKAKSVFLVSLISLWFDDTLDNRAELVDGGCRTCVRKQRTGEHFYVLSKWDICKRDVWYRVRVKKGRRGYVSAGNTLPYFLVVYSPEMANQLLIRQPHPVSFSLRF